jgi:hypothetical protein
LSIRRICALGCIECQVGHLNRNKKQINQLKTSSEVHQIFPLWNHLHGVLYRPHCTVPHCTVPHCTVPHCAGQVVPLNLHLLFHILNTTLPNLSMPLYSVRK